MAYGRAGSNPAFGTMIHQDLQLEIVAGLFFWKRRTWTTVPTKAANTPIFSLHGTPLSAGPDLSKRSLPPPGSPVASNHALKPNNNFDRLLPFRLIEYDCS